MESVRILVVGSIVLDRVLRVTDFPRPGESVRGEVVGVFPGGKGANQAVCAARLGAITSFCGAIGPDPDGTEMIMKLRSEQIDCTMVHSIERSATGTAGITLNDLGQNTIVVALGANMLFEPEQALKAAHQQLHHVLLLPSHTRRKRQRPRKKQHHHPLYIPPKAYTHTHTQLLLQLLPPPRPHLAPRLRPPSLRRPHPSLLPRMAAALARCL